MESIGGLFILFILGVAAFSLVMRAAGRPDVPDGMAKGIKHAGIGLLQKLLKR